MDIIPHFKHILTVAGIYLTTAIPVFSQSWPEITIESCPATRWWWLGSAVDTANLTYNLETYAQAGLGSMVYREMTHTKYRSYLPPGCGCYSTPVPNANVSEWKRT